MGATSFTVELAAISIAGQMGREDGRAQVCVTDSESSMKHIANKTKKPGSCPGYLSETARHGWDEVEGRTVRFQKSHAERRANRIRGSGTSGVIIWLTAQRELRTWRTWRQSRVIGLWGKSWS